jgi:hypothetical protein
VKAGKHRKYFARKNQNNNNNFITKSIVNMGGSISAGTVAQFVRNNHLIILDQIEPPIPGQTEPGIPDEIEPLILG